VTVKIANPAGRAGQIQQIETARNSKLLIYVTVDRPDLSGMVGDDTYGVFFEHLEAIGHQPQIDLFLYTRGGYTLAPVRIVNLIREYCDRFTVLVPHRAHSAGTTIAIGADEIVMHRMGELGPIDPSAANNFNPLDPDDPDKKRRIPISVEDVTAYLALARNQAGVPEERMAPVFEALTREVHPLALGNLHRQYLLIRSMGKRLLGMHMADPDKIEHVLDTLTEKLYFHGYPLTRREAREHVGLPAVDAPPTLEAAMWQLLQAYDGDLGLGRSALDPQKVGSSAPVEVEAAVIESTVALHTFAYTGTARAKSPPGKPPEVEFPAVAGWRKVR
jgi:hypothetical protein